MQLSLQYAAYGENAISGDLPDDAVMVFFVAKKKEPKYPRVHHDEEFAEEWRPTVRKEVDGLKERRRIWHITWEQAIAEGYRQLP